MRGVLKWLGVVLGVVLALVVIALGIFWFKGNAVLTRKYAIAPEAIAIPTDPAAIERGKHFVQAICSDCHAADLSGRNMLNAPFAVVDSANLTRGSGGAGADFTEADWVRALRHGVDNEGRGLVIMPSQLFWNFNDQDLGDIIAYLKTIPPVDKQHADPQANPIGRMMIGAGMFGPGIVSAGIIQHDQRPPVVPEGVTAPYGGYLVSVTGCRDCHGAQLAGGKSADPAAIAAPNLTPGGELKVWTEAQFISTIRTGTAPSGHELNPEQMPWKQFATYSDDELRAIFLYLQSQPSLESVKPN
jgi:mono/diheme cytochrome c family protein